MATNSLLNALTQIDVTGPDVDVTRLVPKAPRGIQDGKQTGDSEYRDALARTLEKPGRKKSEVEKNRASATETGKRAEQTRNNEKQNKGTKAASSSAEENRTTGEKSRKSDDSQPADGLRNKPASAKTGNETKANDDTKSNDTKSVHVEGQSHEHGDRQYFEIQAAAGSPPAQFQPITVTTLIVDEISVDNGDKTSTGTLEIPAIQTSEEFITSDLPQDGLANARSVIENLIDNYEITSGDNKLPDDETPLPPAGLFQALETLINLQEASHQNADFQQSELPDVETPENPSSDTQQFPENEIAIPADAVNFEVTPAETTVAVNTNVTNDSNSVEDPAQIQQPLQNIGVSADLSANTDSLESEVLSAQTEESTGEDSRNQSLEQIPADTNPVQQTVASEDRPQSSGEVVLPRPTGETIETGQKQAQSRADVKPQITVETVSSGKERPEATVLKSAGTGETNPEPLTSTTPSASTGSSQVRIQNSSDPAAGSAFRTESSTKTTGPTQHPALKEEWNPEKLVNRVANAIRTAGRDGQQLKMRLHPPELGTLQIEVTSRGGVLTARLEVQTSTAHQALLENMALLKETLAQNGTRLDHIDVHLNDSWNEQAQANSDEQQQQDGQNQQNDNQEETSEHDTDENEQAPQLQPIGSNTRLDQLDIQI